MIIGFLDLEWYIKMEIEIFYKIINDFVTLQN